MLISLNIGPLQDKSDERQGVVVREGTNIVLLQLRESTFLLFPFVLHRLDLMCLASVRQVWPFSFTVCDPFNEAKWQREAEDGRV